jgi:hypothetical protein
VASPLVAVLSRPRPCACRCHETLTPGERAEGIAALFRFDDMMRGWGYAPIYDANAHQLWRAAQAKNDPSYRGIAVRDEACVHRRLVGFAVHELIHALNGDVSKANYGVPFGLPYGVPHDVPEGKEAEYLHPFNQGEARAFVGVARLASGLFAIEWSLRTARDVGTYGFVGGNAIVDVPAGFRQVPHVDRQRQPQRYYALARRLEDEARVYLDEQRIAEMCARARAAEADGARRRTWKWPSPESLARLAPQPLGRNDACSCGSGKKWKKCCGAATAA